MTLTIVALLFLVLVGIYLNARMRAARHLRIIAEEKGDIAKSSGMTASLGVFYPDVNVTVIMGVSEEIGACYYRVLRDGKIIIPNHDEVWATLAERAASPDAFIARKAAEFEAGDSGLPNLTEAEREKLRQ